MRVFKNLGSPETLPIILTHIDSQDKKTSVWAVKALKALPASVFLDDRVKQKLEIIYFQVDRPYDSSARTLALDMLLDHQPDSTFLINVLISLSMGGSENLELNTYSLQRLQEYAGNDPVVRSQLKQILSDRPSLNNYHVFAQNGMSTTFSRDLYRNVDGNGSFRLGENLIFNQSTHL
jgi:microsomal triglyceride transfer protein large subunit